MRCETKKVVHDTRIIRIWNLIIGWNVITVVWIILLDKSCNEKNYSNAKSSREYIHVRDAAKSTVELIEKKLINKVVNITGHQTIKIIDLLDMIREILLIKKKVRFLNKNLPGHYSKVPHTFDNDPALKYVTSPYVDFSQGLYDLIKQIKKDI